MQNPPTTKFARSAKPTTGTNPKKTVETQCAECDKSTKCTFRLESRKVADPSMTASFAFCTKKCQNDYKKKKLKADYVTATLESVYPGKEYLTSDDYQMVSLSAPWSEFYNHILCIFHSKLFKQFVSQLAFLKEGLQTQRRIEKEQKNEFQAEIGFQQMFAATGNLIAILKQPGLSKTIDGDDPAIETFAFIRQLLLRSQDMSQASKSKCWGSLEIEEPRLFYQYYPQADSLPIDKQVLFFLVYMFAQVLLVHRTNPSLKDQDLRAELVKIDLEKEIEDIKLTISEGQPLIPDIENSEEPDFQTYWDSEVRRFFKQLADGKSIDLSAVIAPWALPKKCNPGYGPYLQVLKIPASRLATVSQTYLRLETNSEVLTITLMKITQKFKLTFQRIRSFIINHYGIKYAFRFALVTKNSHKNKIGKQYQANKISSVRFLNDFEDVWQYITLPKDTSVRIVQILQTLVQTEANLSTQETHSLSHTPVEELTAVEYLYHIEKPTTAASPPFLSELFAVRNLDVSDWCRTSKTMSPIKATHDFVLGLLALQETIMEIQEIEFKAKWDSSQHKKPIYQVMNQIVFVAEQRPDGTRPELTAAQRTQLQAEVLAAHKEDLTTEHVHSGLASLECKLYFDYDMQEILEALIGPEELERLQEDMVEKNGPPTVLMIQFEKGMQLPMLGYYFLRAFSAGENLFSIGLPKSQHLGLSSLQIKKAEAVPEIYLNKGNHRTFINRNEQPKKVNLFSSLQGHLDDTPVTCLEPEWITQIIYEIQEKTESAAKK